MFETSSIELSRSALQNNLRFIRKKMKPGVRFCSVVKGNAYGHGLSEFVGMAIASGVNYFAVYSAEEAYRLLEGSKEIPDVFIMGAIDNDAIAWAVKEQIEFAVFDFQRLETAIMFAKRYKLKVKVHVEIETGMQRTGFDTGLIPELSKLIHANSDNITLQGIFTHLAGAESQANHFRITEQIRIFNLAVKAFESEGLKPVYIHSACSAGLLNYPDAPGNMVRIGIIQYGFWPNKESQIRSSGENESVPDPLKRIIRWRTEVMALKEVNKGSFIGYGTSYLSHKKLKLAVLPVGYSHGYSRNLSNVGSVLIKGKSAPVVGIVNMNSLTVDITHILEVTKGDEVVLIGKQNGKAISVNSFSEQSHQLNYELLTRLPFNIPRTIID